MYLPSNFHSERKVQVKCENALIECFLYFQVLKQNMGIGGVVSLLWFQRSLPPYVCKFFEMCLMVTADHGPAVSGAHNTIVCARAGKDLVSSLVSGLLTIVSELAKLSLIFVASSNII